jgi:antitoxin MazE
METVIKKWGKSPAVRLSSAAMKIASFDVEQQVTINASKGAIVIESCGKFNRDIDVLVAGITQSDLHGEVDFGRCTGKEIL